MLEHNINRVANRNRLKTIQKEINLSLLYQISIAAQTIFVYNSVAKVLAMHYFKYTCKYNSFKFIKWPSYGSL